MSFERKTFLLTAIAFVCLVVFYSVALAKQLFFYYWWYDILLHFLGGLTVSLAALCFYLYSGYFKIPLHTENQIFYTALAAALIVGILWEFFEYFTGLAFVIGSYSLDTAKDLSLDTFGAIVTYIYFMRHFHEL